MDGVWNVVPPEKAGDPYKIVPEQAPSVKLGPNIRRFGRAPTAEANGVEVKGPTPFETRAFDGR